MEKEKNFLSAVVYVRNARSSIGGFLSMLTGTLFERFEHWEVICVNDCSDDDSVSAIREFAKKHGPDLPEITILNMSYFHGVEVAMNAGCDLAIGDFVMEFDTTVIDYDKYQILAAYNKALEGFDVVSAVPDRRERGTSRLFYRIFEKYSELSYRMHTETFRVVSRRLINRVLDTSRTVPYRKALYAGSGLKSASLRYTPLSGTRNQPLTRQEKRYRRNLAADSLILFTSVGYRASLLLTVVMMAVAIFTAVYSVIVFAVGHPVEGWTTTILFLSAAFFGLFAILTIVIKYLQILVDLMFRRKRYNFESIEKL